MKNIIITILVLLSSLTSCKEKENMNKKYHWVAYVKPVSGYPIRTCTPTFILYKKKGDKIFVRIQLENFSYATAGEYDYFISLEFKNNKCISSKIEEVPWSELDEFGKYKKQR